MTNGGFIRTVLGDRSPEVSGTVYAHEHLIIDSPLIESKFPDIHLFDVDAATAELAECAEVGVRLVIDAMPCSAGRDAARLAEIARGSGVDVVAATGLHHERYYGPRHWSNRVGVDRLVELFVKDLLDGIDIYDYTGPVVERGSAKAGIIKLATSGPNLDERDVRNLEAGARASAITGAPILTHCEGGYGANEQVEFLMGRDIPASSILVSHVDKAGDLEYLRSIAGMGAVLEFDQSLRHAHEGAKSFSVGAIAQLIGEGFGAQIVVGTDGARRTLWHQLGGSPGLSWLGSTLPKLLAEVGVDQDSISMVMGANAARALTWRAAGV